MFIIVLVQVVVFMFMIIFFQWINLVFVVVFHLVTVLVGDCHCCTYELKPPM